MIIPLMILLGLVCISVKHRANLQSPAVVSGARNYGAPTAGVIRVEPSAPLGRRFREELQLRLNSGHPVTRWLVDNAILEAFNQGDMRSVSSIVRAFGKPRKRMDADADASEKQPPASEKQTVADSSTSNSEPDLSEIGQPSLKSPVDGMSDDDWMEFVARVRTKSPGFRSDKYVGQYEQNRSRLKQLGMSEPKTSEEEYEALARDMHSHAQDSAELIKQWVGDVVNVDGVEHPICTSGVLGLLKSAGPEGARSWLMNPSDRKQFPKTTEAFIRTNGCFDLA